MASRRRSTSVSTRLTKNEATLCTVDRSPPSLGEGLEAGQVGLDDLGVAGQGEDQGDVDAAALGDHRLDGGDALGGRRDLHEQVGLGDPLVQRRGRRRCVACGVAGQLGGDLDGHEAVGAAAGVEDRAQHGRGRR